MYGSDWRRRSSTRGGIGSFRGAVSETVGSDVDGELCRTWAERKIQENKLAVMTSARKIAVGEKESCLALQDVEEEVKVEQAKLRLVRVKQQRELLEAQDVEKLKKMHATRVMRQTETNKVAVEKAFCSLAGSGNVPSLVGGHASTVKSGSISPNSSVSEAEVRALQKGFADLKASNESLENRMRHLKLCAERKDVIGMMATVATFEPEGCEDSVGLTIPEGGVPSIWYGEGAGGYVGKDGRFHSEPEETFGYESLSF